MRPPDILCPKSKKYNLGPYCGLLPSHVENLPELPIRLIQQPTLSSQSIGVPHPPFKPLLADRHLPSLPVDSSNTHLWLAHEYPTSLPKRLGLHDQSPFEKGPLAMCLFQPSRSPSKPVASVETATAASNKCPTTGVVPAQPPRDTNRRSCLSFQPKHHDTTAVLTSLDPSQPTLARRVSNKRHITGVVRVYTYSGQPNTNPFGTSLVLPCGSRCSNFAYDEPPVPPPTSGLRATRLPDLARVFAAAGNLESPRSQTDHWNPQPPATVSVHHVPPYLYELAGQCSDRFRPVFHDHCDLTTIPSDENKGERNAT